MISPTQIVLVVAHRTGARPPNWGPAGDNQNGGPGVWWVTGVVLAVAVVALVVGRPQRRRLRELAAPAARRRPGGRVEQWLAARLVSADIDRPASLVAASWAVAVGLTTALGLMAGGPVLGLLGALVAGLAPSVVLSATGGRRDARLARELPALLESVARSLRSGAAIPSALREASATGSAAAADLAEVVAETDRGLGLGEALGRWADRRPLPAVRLAVGVLSVALASGGTPARAIDGAAATLRERAEVDRELQALATQARTSAVVVTLAPLAFAGLGVLGDQQTATFLLRTPTGLVCLAVGVALDGFGAWWMTRIAASAS